jgi:aminoglycoside phosphotransferase (APT) family kinase protein
MLHEGEYDIDNSTVAHLIGSQMPHWADLPLRRLDTAGTANVAYRLGADTSAPQWDGPPSWFHGDLYVNNLLARDGELVAVIDFEGCSAGDPSIDLIASWWMFDRSSREVFRETIEPDDAQWRRAKGWALFMGISAAFYYQDTNPTFAELAGRAIDEILENA